jgi:cytochrome P450 family 110
MDLLLAARFADGSAMSETEVRDHLVSLVSPVMRCSREAWCRLSIGYIVSERRMIDCALSWIGQVADQSATIIALPYLDAVCRETLRLSPIIPEVTRRLREPLDLLRTCCPCA